MKLMIIIWLIITIIRQNITTITIIIIIIEEEGVEWDQRGSRWFAIMDPDSTALEEEKPAEINMILHGK